MLLPPSRLYADGSQPKHFQRKWVRCSMALLFISSLIKGVYGAQHHAPAVPFSADLKQCPLGAKRV